VNEQKAEQNSEVRDQEIRAALDQHWAASDASDFETEHLIYREDAVLDYPQSGERTRGRRNIQGQRASQPGRKRFTVRRIIGGGDLWVAKLVITYDRKPSYTVSVMEFRDDKVARETVLCRSRRNPAGGQKAYSTASQAALRRRRPLGQAYLRRVRQPVQHDVGRRQQQLWARVRSGL